LTKTIFVVGKVMTNYVADLTSTVPFRQREASDLAGKLRTDATITDGVIRWNSNDQVPPADCVALAAHIGLSVDVAKSNAARSADLYAFLVSYRTAQAQRTPEQIAEERAMARAAHGPGVWVVNIFTDESFRT